MNQTRRGISLCYQIWLLRLIFEGNDGPKKHGEGVDPVPIR